MTSQSPENNDSPTATSFGRKNKLGYTRISVACAHCRRRKIRCVRAEEDDSGRCANCIKLKKECIFTNVDTANSVEGRTSSKPGMNSQTSSVLSRSPSGVSPDHRDGIDHPSQSMYSDLPGVLPIARGHGVMMPSGPLHGDLQRSSHHDWPSHALDGSAGGYSNPQSAIPWSHQSETLRNYSPGGFPATGPSLAYSGYIDHARGEPARHPQWPTTTEHSAAPPYQSHMSTVPSYVQHSSAGFPTSYDHPNTSMASQPVVPSQFYPQRSGPGSHLSEPAYSGWSYNSHDAPLPGSPRHDSMANNWSRGPSYSGGSFPAGYDPRTQHQRYSKGAADPPG